MARVINQIAQFTSAAGGSIAAQTVQTEGYDQIDVAFDYTGGSVTSGNVDKLDAAGNIITTFNVGSTGLSCSFCFGETLGINGTLQQGCGPVPKAIKVRSVGAGTTVVRITVSATKRTV